MSDVNTLLQSIVAGIGEQISDLGPSPLSRVSVDAVVTDLTNLQPIVTSEPTATQNLVSSALAAVQAVAAGTKTIQDLGPVLGNLDTLGTLLDANATAKSLVATIVTRVTNLLSYRPDVQAILGDLQAIKSLRGGPADAIAFHDFHVLQLAFKNVWIEAFDERLRSKAEDLYSAAVKLYTDAGASLPDPGTIEDIDDLNEFINSIRAGTAEAPPIPNPVAMYIPGAAAVWPQLSAAQQAALIGYAEALTPPFIPGFGAPALSPTAIKQMQDAIEQILKAPEGPVTTIAKLIQDLGTALSEPYKFDVFAENSFNFGLLLTYRQQWTPGEYQAGDLRATIPLAPSETRKYTKKTNIKITRAQREIEKSVTASSLQTSDTQRAEASIMQKTDTATNFKMTAEGSYNVGVIDIKATTEFAASQASESVANKKDFRESTVKAAQEYRLERSLEVDTASSFETDETVSGEISNPNNEITVTYLFYELQRRYQIAEQLYRVRPVILVAQWVPAPHEVDEAFLIENNWIFARVLLDESLRPALEYLSSGFAGDQVSIEVLRAQWENLRDVSAQLESQLQNQVTVRNYYRDQVAELTMQENQAKAVDNNLGWLAKLSEDVVGNFSGGAVDMIAAKEKYAESVLQNVNDNIADLQNKLKQATDALQAASARYSEALQKQFARTVAIDQLRIHVKQNIIYYMQAIWAHEPPDQRFFRLYKQQVFCPGPDVQLKIPVKGVKKEGGRFTAKLQLNKSPPTVMNTKDLVEIADLDNPLGYKGNYIIFPLKQTCFLTTYMLQEFITETYGLKDPDRFAAWKNLGSIDAVAKDVASQLAKLDSAAQRQKLINDFADYVNETGGEIDEIIIPTGQLFIEALPGSHPLLEDFKLLHRAEDVRKVKAEVRHAELENLRLATRLVASQADAKNTSMLEDPDIEKKIVVEASADVKTP